MSAPRPYQARAIVDVLKLADEGCRSICLVAPTGAGKTVMAASLVQEFVRRQLRVLFVAHRIELVEQAIARLGVPCGVIVAGAPESLARMQVVVGSLQTIARREIERFDVVLVDEAHHIMSKSYTRLLERQTGALIVGLTATPTRLDGKGLGDVFGKLVEASTVSKLIEEGYLIRPRVFSTPETPDLAAVHKVAGDFNEHELELAVNRTTLRGDIVRHWKERSDGRPTVLFAVSIQHSRDLIADFTAAGVSAVHVDGTMNRTNRDAALAAVRSGAARVLCNVGIVTEGWDFPELETCVLARPTASLSLCMQMVGRVMRPAPGKPGALVLDHAGNMARLGYLPWIDVPWSLEQTKTKGAGVGVKTCPECFAQIISTARQCEACGHVFSAARAASDGTPEYDRAAQLQEITSPAMLALSQYLERRRRYGEEQLKPYTQKLVERFQKGKTSEAFAEYVLRARGSIGKAAYEFKQATGRWP